jgi:hypothetical protein
MSDVRLALVVTVDRYDDDALRRRATPAADAVALADVLRSPDLGGFEVDVLYNPAAATITRHLEQLFTDGRPADLVLLHFTGHGLLDEDGRLHLAATDTRPGRLDSTAVGAAFINRLMRRSRARRIGVMLDCRVGPGGDSPGIRLTPLGDQFAPHRNAPDRGRVVLAAHTPDGDDASQFTGALVEGLRTGAADRDRDGFVTPGELHGYVRDRMSAGATRMWEFGRSDDLWVARNPHLWDRHRSLTPELVERARHPDAASRLAAANEITPIAFEPDRERAASACAVLRVLSTDANLQVRMTAAAALEQASIRPARDVIDLGVVLVDESPVGGEVPVRGSPIALASTVTATGPMKAWLDGPVLRVLWTGGPPGDFAETVTLTSPAGVAQVRVVGEAIAIAPAPAAHRGTAVVSSGPPEPPARRVLPLVIAVVLALVIAGVVYAGFGP